MQITKVWVVQDSDYDNTWIVAAYPTAEMATEHVATMGGHVEAIEVRSTLHPDATDPAKQKERADEKEKNRKQWESQQRQQHTADKLRAEMRPSARMGLCHCATFTKRPHLINAHGYCGYCGGFTPDVFLENLGEAALHAEINKLAEHDRRKMREIVAKLITKIPAKE